MDHTDPLKANFSCKFKHNFFIFEPLKHVKNISPSRFKIKIPSVQVKFKVLKPRVKVGRRSEIWTRINE